MTKNNKGGGQTSAQRKASKRNFDKMRVAGAHGSLCAVRNHTKSSRERHELSCAINSLGIILEEWDGR